MVLKRPVTATGMDNGYDGPERRKPIVLDESWGKFVAKIGLGGIAVFLVWQLAGEIKTNTAQTSMTVLAHTEQTKAQNQDRDRILQMMANVLVQQCVNAASTKDKRDACFEAINRSVWVREPNK